MTRVDAMQAPFITRRRRPFLTPIWLSGLFLLLALAVLGVCIALYQSATTTTIVVVGGGSRGVAGQPERTVTADRSAERLVQLFSGAQTLGRIDALYISEARGMDQLASQLASRLRLAPVVLADADGGAMAARALSEHRGGAVLIMVRQASVPSLIRALSGLTAPASLGDDAQLFVVAVPTFGSAGLLRLSY